MIFCLGCYATRHALVGLGGNRSNELKQQDPQEIVIDEWAGLALALTTTSHIDLWRVFSAFALFRLFDIIKPPPVSWLEKCKAEWGIMLDDLAAGLYALIFLAILDLYW